MAHTDPAADRLRRRAYVATVAGMLAITAVANDRVLHWRGDVHLHTVMEVAATWLALAAGVLGLVHYAAQRQRLFLLLGVGLLGTGLLDGYHALVTSAPMVGRLSAAHERLVPWSWWASRVFLAIWMLGTVRASLEPVPGVDKAQVTVWRHATLASAVVVLAAAIFATAAVLPPAMQTGVLGRPQEWVPGLLLALAALHWGRRGVWREQVWAHWLMLSLIVGAALQVGPMALSHALHDTEFNVAHLLKKLSYLLVLTGLTLSLLQALRDRDSARRALRHQVEQLQHAQQQLLEQQRWLGIVAQYTADWETWIDPDGKMLYCSAAAEAITGYPAQDFLSGRRTMTDLLAPSEPVALARHFEHPPDAPPESFDVRIVRADGQERWINHTCQPYYDEQGRYLGRRGSNRDITQRKEDELRLQVLRTALDHSPVGVVITDAETTIRYVNLHLLRMTGYAEAELLGSKPSIWRSGQHDRAFYQQMWATLQSRLAWHGEICNRRKNGELYWESIQIAPIVQPDGSLVAYVAIKQDITQQRQERERLYHHATHDPLTGLSNRRHFQDRVHNALQRRRRTQQNMTLLMVDLDHFKEVNDRLGHDVGDALLQEAARRMLAVVREGDTVARLGGDEFALLLESADDLDRAHAVAERLRAALSQAYPSVGPEPLVSASVGGTLLSSAATCNWRTWLHSADEALYDAKAAGRNCVRLRVLDCGPRDDAAAGQTEV